MATYSILATAKQKLEYMRECETMKAMLRAKQIRDMAGKKIAIGSAFNAEVAATLTADYALPEGWKYLSCGAWRNAFLGPDGVVYKRDIMPEYSDNTGNSNEAKTFKTLREKGYQWIPQFRLFDNGIIAVQFLHNCKDFRRMSYENRIRWEEIRRFVSDSKGNNIGLDDSGLLFLRDGGHGEFSCF